MSRRVALTACIAVALGVLPSQRAMAEAQQSVEELRNTVINLLQALVDQGVISREKAQALVAQAQQKAATEAAARDKQDEGAIRVPYVPEPVREQIRKEVASEVEPAIVDRVVAQAKAEGWGVPAALPDWLGRVRVTGELRLRAEGDFYASDNIRNYYLDFQTINSKGGIAKAGAAAFLDVNDNRERLRTRARLGIESTLSPSLSAGLRVTTGNLQDPGSANQTLGNYGARYQAGFDLAWLRWEGKTANQFPWLTAIGGRIPSPWFAPTDLVYHRDLNFEGVAATGRLGFGDGSAQQSHAFLTIGAFPMQDVQPASRDKWLLGAQLGTRLRWGDDQSLRVAAAYYNLRHVEGQQNQPNSQLLDYTAPPYLRQGNTLFDIRNDADPSTNLFALASKFRLVDVSLAYTLPIGRYTLGVAGDYVKNTGFNAADILARTGGVLTPRTKGYQAEVSAGDPALTTLGAWRVTFGYRYLQRDAVLDAWTDSDFHGGGTDAQGYYFIGDLGLSKRTFFRIRYLSANEIDGPRYAVDVLQLDLNAAF